MPKLLPVAFGMLMALLLTAAALAQDAAEVDRMSKMSNRDLIDLVSTITASVGQDTLKLQGASQRDDCLELTRAANSFALGYQMLAAADASLSGKPVKETVQLKVHIVQSRVITFAARVRAEEYLSRRCVGFTAPADKASEPRYGVPAKIQTAEYTQAVIDARLAADANLANAIAAGRSRKCSEVVPTMQSIQLFVPYLDKLATDMLKRPEALGPRASRRALEAARGQLVAAGNRLYREIGISCPAQPAPVPPADAEPPGGETPPATNPSAPAIQ